MTHIPRFEDYFISERTGFMLEEPLDELPEYFDVWNQLGKGIAVLLEQHQLRDAVDQMPLLEAGQLNGHREKRLAYMLLSFIGNGYIWQEGDAGVVRMVPQQLAVPWCCIAESLGVKAALSHPCFVLSNWKTVEPSRDLQTICQLPGDEHAKLFILLTAQVEFDAVSGLRGILGCMNCVAIADEEGMVTELEIVNNSLQKMISTLTQLSRHFQLGGFFLPNYTQLNDDLIQLQLLMGEKNADIAHSTGEVDPNVFYKQIRPFLAGWGGMQSPLPEGLIYEGVSTKPTQVIGASAAQSSTLQCFDAALGIIHEPEKQEFLDKMREYMMPHHRAFIEALWQAPSIRQTVKASSNSVLLSAYNKCVDAVQTFRMYHIQIVAKFIITMSDKWKSQEKYEAVSKLGTGGQSLVPFLKTLRDTTSQHTLGE